MKYEPMTFTVPDLDGISNETINDHIGLYEGYVKNVNAIQEKITAYSTDREANTLAISELQRRLGFEFGGMRNHEYYFKQFEGGAKALPKGKLKDLIEKQWGSFDTWLTSFKTIVGTRGIGWAMLYYDRHTEQLVQTWVDEQHLGQLPDLQMVLGLDMWEHSYLRDYRSSEKGQYVEAFFKNLNWEIVAERLS